MTSKSNSSKGNKRTRTFDFGEEAARVERFMSKLRDSSPAADDASPPQPVPLPERTKVAPVMPEVKKPSLELVRKLGMAGTNFAWRFEMLYEALAKILPGGESCLRPIDDLGLRLVNEFTVARVASVYRLSPTDVLTQARDALGTSADASLQATVVAAGGRRDHRAKGTKSPGWKAAGIRFHSDQFIQEADVANQFVKDRFPAARVQIVHDYLFEFAISPSGVRFEGEVQAPVRAAVDIVFPEGTLLVFDPPVVPPSLGR